MLECTILPHRKDSSTYGGLSALRQALNGRTHVQMGFSPLKSDKDAVLASCRFSKRAPIRIFWSKILDDAYTYPEIMFVNP